MNFSSRALTDALSADWSAWVAGGAFDTAALTFWARDPARLAFAGFALALLFLLALHAAIPRRRGRGQIVIPALPAALSAPRVGWPRHVPALLLAAGFPFALLALADPHAAQVASDVTYPGRRIALMIDASDSMRSDFSAPSLNAGAQQAFFTTTAAAKRFVELRRAGRYRDLIALIEFGNRAYVVTPFTNDYDNLLLSIALIADPEEFSAFPDPGTVIGPAVEQSVALFETFDFLEASGNAMVILTDGEDTNAMVGGRWLDEVLVGVAGSGIPLYFVRINYNKGEDEGVPDSLWRNAVEKAGGQFYIARDERSLLDAIADIDRDATGSVQRRQYAAHEPRFAGFALMAAALWAAAAVVRLMVPACATLT